MMAAALWAGCSSSEPDPVTLNNTDSGRIVPIASGQAANLVLQTIGPGQYGTPTISSASVLFLGMSFPSEQNPGGPRQLYQFRAATSGQADISIPHVGDLTGTPSFTFSLVVR
jgi:hypothetical protein